ncbi:MAG: T9SS type A sorting domain-containing protein [Bacteroidales bacterium]|jgi:sugar lactone lactonase YvrE|nr:T9SS type A sorting domain-containing protein [Bacteroidales bacterium]
MRIWVVTGVLLVIALGLQAQPANGKWQDYLSFVRAVKVADAGDKVFCATDGGLFYVDTEGGSIHKISSKDGLSDVGIRTIAWHGALEMLVVVYRNSNIDLITGNRIVNLGDIKRKLLPGDKTVYNVMFQGERAYLACGFGIVDIDLRAGEIRGTYVIGENGSQVRVFDVASDGQQLYAATAKGLLTAPVGHPNLLDYRSWSRLETVPHAGEKFSHLAMVNQNLVAVYTRDQYDGDEAYLFSEGVWRRVMREVPYFNDLTVAGSVVTATGREQVFLFDTSLSLSGRIGEYLVGETAIKPINPSSAVVSAGGNLWIADQDHSLIRVTAGKSEQYLPGGPLNNHVFSLATYGNQLWVSAGGRTDPWNNQFRSPLFQCLEEGEWSYYSKREYPSMEGFWDIVQVAVDPRDPGRVYAASWGGGVLEFRNGSFEKRYDHQNSPLQTALPEQPQDPYTRIGGIAFDAAGQLWITNAQSSKGLHTLSPSGEWKSFELTGVSGFQYTIGQLIVTSADDKWIILPRGRDLYVVDKEGARKKQLPVTSYFNNGEQEIFNRMNDVYAITEDLEGEIWVGTSRGVAVFANPRRVWNEDNFYAYQPSLELNDGLYHPLLEKETVTAIVVDGANRKWLGTRNSGLYLVSERGTAELLHFNTDNSPLLSNTITSLAMHPVSGELFIGTDQGLISYQADAPAGRENLAGVYVYPNPVRESYHGEITVAGLMKDTDVHITDIAGNLVFKTTSLGSKVTWDGRNLNGRRVATGVYLVFCADATGNETQMAKLLFIR